MTFYSNRTASLAISFLGAVVNLAFLLRVWSSSPFKWVPESEWEGSSDPWKADGVKLVWGLLSAYFTAATAVCSVGLIGILKSKPSYVRFYRDYSIADFSFCAIFAVVGTYAAFHTSLGAGVCEELSRQPELMRDMVEMGLNLENCELWFERAVLAFMGAAVVLVVIRLHFIIAVSNYYSQLLRHKRTGLPLHTGRSDDCLQRIYLLPQTPRASSPRNDVLIYAPVPLSSLSPLEHASATEAWVARTDAGSPCTHSHRHRHHSSGSTGRISLPVRPGEGLLPAYEEAKAPSY